MTALPNRLTTTLQTTGLLVLCGSGGVGKTTTSAALALTAALSGRKVLVLTIDPAQRLLQALGLHGQGHPANTPLEVLPRMAATLPEGMALTAGGSLHAMMLDAESGAVAMVERLLPDPSLRGQVLGNRIYRALLPTLSASPDYVALELVATVMAERRFDLVVLDTPPMQNAVDLLHAGHTLASFINERVLRWFAKVPAPGEKGGRFSFISAGSSMAMSVLGRLIGSETLPDIAQFFTSFRDVLPKVRDRAAQTDAMLRSPATRFIIVAAPGETSLREAHHLHAELREQGVPLAGFIVNRVVQVPAGLADPTERVARTQHLRQRLERSGIEPGRAAEMTERLVQAAARLNHLGEADESHVAALQRLAPKGTFCAVAAEREEDLHTLGELTELGRRLLDGVRPAVVES